MSEHFNSSVVLQAEADTAISVKPTHVDFGESSDIEELEWFCSAVLAKLDVGVRLTSEGQQLLERIRRTPEMREAVREVLITQSQPNEFDFVVMPPEDAERVRAFILDSSDH